MISIEKSLSSITLKNAAQFHVKEICDILLDKGKDLPKLSLISSNFSAETLESLYNSPIVQSVYLENCKDQEIETDLNKTLWLKHVIEKETCIKDFYVHYFMAISKEETTDFLNINTFFFAEMYENSKLKILGCSFNHRNVLENLNNFLMSLLINCNYHVIISEFDDDRIEAAFDIMGCNHHRVWKPVLKKLKKGTFPVILSISHSFKDAMYTFKRHRSYLDYTNGNFMNHFYKTKNSILTFERVVIPTAELMKLLKLIEKQVETSDIYEVDMSNVRISEVFNDEAWSKIVNLIKTWNVEISLPIMSLSSDQFLDLITTDPLIKFKPKSLKKIQILDAYSSTEFERDRIMPNSVLGKFTKCFLYRFENEAKVWSSNIRITNEQFEWVLCYL